MIITYVLEPNSNESKYLNVSNLLQTTWTIASLCGGISKSSYYWGGWGGIIMEMGCACKTFIF